MNEKSIWSVAVLLIFLVIYYSDSYFLLLRSLFHAFPNLKGKAIRRILYPQRVIFQSSTSKQSVAIVPKPMRDDVVYDNVMFAFVALPRGKQQRLVSVYTIPFCLGFTQRHFCVLPNWMLSCGVKSDIFFLGGCL